MRLIFLNKLLYTPLGDGGLGDLISVNEAKTFIYKNTSQLPSINLPLDKAAGYVLAEDVFAIADIPAFNQSSVDGYAFAFADIHERLIINGEAAAGTKENLPLSHRHAI